MRWVELDLERGEWLIPAYRMKMRRPFTKYLSAPVADLLADLRERRGLESEYVFPGRISGCISENIMGLALQRLFYDPAEHTPHGFRASASTMLHEAGEDHEVIEAALGHRPRDQVAAAYNRAQYADRQRELHATWSSMIAGMKAGAA
jgi:integrase